MPGRETNSRVTHRDLADLLHEIHGWCEDLGARIEAQAVRTDNNFVQIRDSLEALRLATNHRMEQFEERMDKIEKEEAARIALSNFKNALLRGSWKLTSLIITATSILTGLLVKYGEPWSWRFGR